MSRNPGQGHATVVQLLLENKADVSHSFDEAGHFGDEKRCVPGAPEVWYYQTRLLISLRDIFRYTGLKMWKCHIKKKYICISMYINIYIYIQRFDDINTFGPLGASPHFFQKKWVVIHKKLDAREGVSAAWPPTSWQNVQDIRRRLDVGSPEDMKTARVFFCCWCFGGHLRIFDLNAGILISRICMKH